MRGYFIDIQGTLIDDKDFKPIDGAKEFLEYLNKNKIPYVLLTNNTKRDSKEFIEYLKSLGFNFRNYLDPLMVLDSFISEPIAPFGNEKFLEIMKRYKIDYKNPNSLVVGLKLFSNDEFSDMIELLLNGVKFIGMHKTSLYNKDGRRYPGLGAVLEMLKYATNRDYLVVGKPSVNFFEAAAKKIGLTFDKITIISDDLFADLLPAKSLGMESVLVLSGKMKSVNEINLDVKVYKDVGEYLKDIE